MTTSELRDRQRLYPANMDSTKLVNLAAEWLVPMFDGDTQLFCHRLKLGPGGMVREGNSHRYTMMTLLGLGRLEGAGCRSPIPIKPVLDCLLAQYGWVKNIGDLGLLLWVCSLLAPERLKQVVSAFSVESALARYPEAREIRTMELAWFLSGLAHASLARPGDVVDLSDVAMATSQLIANNQGESGLFGHQGIWRSISGMTRGRFGSFADQVYPIYALTQFAIAYQLHAPLEIALRCAKAICRLQGPQGQWWWHFDASTGAVLQKYPVYSVHQHGMAPMSLFAIGDAMHVDLAGPIYKGLGWIFTNNELATDLRDKELRIIYRNIHEPAYGFHLDRLRRMVRLRKYSEPLDSFRMLIECRPYELGWLLYAFAGR